LSFLARPVQCRDIIFYIKIDRINYWKIILFYTHNALHYLPVIVVGPGFILYEREKLGQA
jgi:hypothetical protein